MALYDRIPNAVQWHEGMLLSPQHFQQSEYRLQRLLTYYLNSVSPYFYGILNLEIDTAALAAGIYRIINFDGVFPDGSIFQYKSEEDPPLERNLDIKSKFDKTLRIYLAIPAHRPGLDNVHNDLARYDSLEGDEALDENMGENIIRIPRLRPKTRILFQEELSAKFTALPIAEIEDTDHGPALGKYIPPLININNSNELREICKNLIKHIREKINYFSDRQEESYALSAEWEAILRPLIHGLLLFETLVNTKGVSPYKIYEALIHLISSAIVINLGQTVPELPPYEHEEIRKCFTALAYHGERSLISLKQNYFVVPFEFEDNAFKLTLKPEWLTKENIFIGIRRSSSITEQELLTWLRGAQIASEPTVVNVKEQRILGASRKIVTSEETGISVSPTMFLISVDIENYYIRPQEKLWIFNSTETLKPKELVLYVHK